MMQELDVEPTIGELKKALNCLFSGKAPGKDGIPPEIVKLRTGSQLTELHAILCLCWRQGQVPQNMQDSNIVTLYKNKGDRSDCNNYWGISLLNIVGKLCCSEETASPQSHGLKTFNFFHLNFCHSPRSPGKWFNMKTQVGF